jgi:GPI mannosyltransferase 3
LILAGALFGLAVCLRYQYGPALAMAALWQHVSDRRRILLVSSSSLAVIAVGSGVFDALTLGLPFQSIWFNFHRNALDHISGAMGVEAWSYLPTYFVAAWGMLLPLFTGLALLGATRAPAFAIAAVTTVVVHSFSPHKEARFIYLAIVMAPMLIGWGGIRLLAAGSLWSRRHTTMIGSMLAVLLALLEARTAGAYVLPAEAWRIDRSTTRAFLAAHAAPNVCGVGIGDFWVYRTGGYTYLHREVPIYFETFERAQHIQGLDIRLAISVVQGEAEVPQYPDSQFATAGKQFNLLIASKDRVLPNFRRIRCFGENTLGKIDICLFRRPGNCQ